MTTIATKTMKSTIYICLYGLILLEGISWKDGRSAVVVADSSAPPTCSVDINEIDPNLVEMKYDVGDGEMTFMAYVEPDISTFYRSNTGDGTDEETKYQKVVPKFNGLAGKFINMSNQRLTFYWESSKNGPSHLMRYYDPFSTGGTGTFPGHRFFLSPEDDKDTRLIEFVVGKYPDNLYVYDPYLVEGDPEQTEKNLKENLSEDERIQYDKWVKTLLFNKAYFNTTGRSYLANYGESFRKPPSHFMWPANYFGEEHWVTTKETHFAEVPPHPKLGKITKAGSARVLKDNDPRILQEYRVPNQTMMNMTLRVLSVAPRVYEIPNFLSEAEVHHIIELAGGIELKQSTTGDVGSNAASRPVSIKEEGRTKTRTSFNSWVPREDSPVIDAIYRRAADLVRIDEALLRPRSMDEYPDLKTKKSIAESLQLVHYGPEQEYTGEVVGVCVLLSCLSSSLFHFLHDHFLTSYMMTKFLGLTTTTKAHHDFGYSNINDNQNGARFATILFYLNEGMEGGETSFPRWVNGETFHKLKVTPEAGKAVLFYSQLPDGNMDDFSQHAAGK